MPAIPTPNDMPKWYKSAKLFVTTPEGERVEVASTTDRESDS